MSSFDFPEFDAVYAAAQKKIERMCARAVRAHLTALANATLDPADASVYLNGIVNIRVDVAQGSASFDLSPDAEEIENGRGPRDMKPALLAHATHIAPDGSRYIDIPLRKSSPRRHRPRPFQAVPREIDGFMRDLQAEAGGGRVRAPRDAFGGGTAAKTVLLPDGAGEALVAPKVGYFQDLIKLPAGTPKAEGDYLTIRRVSTNSDPNSWIYPARPGVNFKPQVDAFIQQIAPSLTEAAIQEVFSGHSRKHRP